MNAVELYCLMKSRSAEMLNFKLIPVNLSAWLTLQNWQLRNYSIEGNHASVFLFQPHLGGEIQTVGCFCSLGTTAAITLAQLSLKCVLLLENCIAYVDGLVCDGASANRLAPATFGIRWYLDNLQNKMTNPCDATRSILFFCDMRHLFEECSQQSPSSERIHGLLIYNLLLCTSPSSVLCWLLCYLK